MFKFLKERKKDNKGFTLVELVIVVAILAILVGILAPQYTKYVEKSRKAADAANLDNLVTAVKVAAADGSQDVVAAADVKYTIEITAGSTTITTTATDAKLKNVKDAVTEYAGKDWGKTTLKSTAWSTATKTIKADVTIEKNGSVTVEYSPEDLKNNIKED